MTNGTPSIDHEARRMADAVKIKLEAHEQHCNERWQMTSASLKQLGDTLTGLDTKISDRIHNVHERIDTLNRRLVWILVVICGFAVIQWFVFAGIAKGMGAM